MKNKSEIRGAWKQRLAGRLAAFVIKLLGVTIRCRLEDPYGLGQISKPVVWIFWHNGLLTVPMNAMKFGGKAPASALTSASKDGAVIESLVNAFGVKAVRGSSSRRGVAALIALKNALKAGDQIFITPDGPRGPRYHLQPGVIKLAQSSGAPIIPLRFTYSSSWRVKTWDRLHIPKPFSTVIIHIDELIDIPAKLDSNTFEIYRNRVEDTLRKGVDDLPDEKQFPKE